MLKSYCDLDLADTVSQQLCDQEKRMFSDFKPIDQPSFISECVPFVPVKCENVHAALIASYTYLVQVNEWLS